MPDSEGAGALDSEAVVVADCEADSLTGLMPDSVTVGWGGEQIPPWRVTRPLTFPRPGVALVKVKRARTGSAAEMCMLGG